MILEYYRPALRPESILKKTTRRTLVYPRCSQMAEKNDKNYSNSSAAPRMTATACAGIASLTRVRTDYGGSSFATTTTTTALHGHRAYNAITGIRLGVHRNDNNNNNYRLITPCGSHRPRTDGVLYRWNGRWSFTDRSSRARVLTLTAVYYEYYLYYSRAVTVSYRRRFPAGIFRNV